MVTTAVTEESAGVGDDSFKSITGVAVNSGVDDGSGERFGLAREAGVSFPSEEHAAHKEDTSNGIAMTKIPNMLDTFIIVTPNTLVENPDKALSQFFGCDYFMFST